MGVQAKRVTPEVMSRTICIFIKLIRNRSEPFYRRFCDLASWLLLSMLVVAFLSSETDTIRCGNSVDG